MAVAIRAITRVQDADDAPALGAGQDGRADVEQRDGRVRGDGAVYGRAADKERRVQAAAEAVQAALREHECDLVAQLVPAVTPDGIVKMFANIQIVAR